MESYWQVKEATRWTKRLKGSRTDSKGNDEIFPRRIGLNVENSWQKELR